MSVSMGKIQGAFLMDDGKVQGKIDLNDSVVMDGKTVKVSDVLNPEFEFKVGGAELPAAEREGFVRSLPGQGENVTAHLFQPQNKSSGLSRQAGRFAPDAARFLDRFKQKEGTAASLNQERAHLNQRWAALGDRMEKLQETRKLVESMAPEDQKKWAPRVQREMKTLETEQAGLERRMEGLEKKVEAFEKSLTADLFQKA